MGQFAVAGTETKEAEADLRVLELPQGLQQGAGGCNTCSGVRGNVGCVPDRRPQQLKTLLHAAAGIRAAQELRREVRKEGSFGELANSN